MGGINVPGLVSLCIFYLLILFLGIGVAWWKGRKSKNQSKSERVMLAGRELGIVVGIFTMTATWVGGGYINGTAEVVYGYGLLHAQAPIGYSISLILGGIFFAKQMRKKEYMTMIDPFQIKYGRIIGGLMYLPALSGELFWSAAILGALGSSISVIMDLDFTISVVVSCCIAVLYTFLGGLYSVAYTDVLQLICIPFGLTSLSLNGSCPTDACFGVMYDKSACIASNGSILTKVYDGNLLGTIEPGAIGSYIDLVILLICGGIPWQAYFQRVLSVDKPWKAPVLSVFAGFGCLIMSIPPAILGIIARHTDWDGTGYTLAKLNKNTLMVLPASIQYLTPTTVSFFGLGAISAAVMSSSDSSILSASSMFAHNIYKTIFRPNAGEVEVVWVLRASVVVCGVVASCLAIMVQSVYGLFILCADFVFVVLFPQLLCVVYVPFVNKYGVLTGYVSGLLFRLLSGEPTLSLPPVIPFSTNVPFRTIAMLINLFLTIVVSLIVNLLTKNSRRNTFEIPQIHSENSNGERLWREEQRATPASYPYSTTGNGRQYPVS